MRRLLLALAAIATPATAQAPAETLRIGIEATTTSLDPHCRDHR